MGRFGFFLVLIVCVLARVWFAEVEMPKVLIKPEYSSLFGQVIEVKKVSDQYTGFLFESSEKRFYLHWYHPKRPLSVGQNWKLYARLKPPVGLHNGVGFDYTSWLKHQEVFAIGYVKSGVLVAPARLNWMNAFRERVNRFISQHFPKRAGLLIALTTGDRSQMKKANWAVLQATGTSHLFAISGLHLGVVLLLFSALIRCVWFAFPSFALYVPAKSASLFLGLLFVTPYAFFVGFSLTVQRALFMLVFFILFELFYYSIDFWHKFIVVAFILLMMNPFSLYSASFYLSFGAIYSIGLVSKGNVIPASKWKQWLVFQSVLFFGLFPITLFFFSKGSFVSPLANLIAVPWMTFLIVPACLLASMMLLIWQSAAAFLFAVANGLLNGLWFYLTCFTL